MFYCIWRFSKNEGMIFDISNLVVLNSPATFQTFGILKATTISMVTANLQVDIIKCTLHQVLPLRNY